MTKTNWIMTGRGNVGESGWVEDEVSGIFREIPKNFRGIPPEFSAKFSEFLGNFRKKDRIY